METGLKRLWGQLSSLGLPSGGHFGTSQSQETAAGLFFYQGWMETAEPGA